MTDQALAPLSELAFAAGSEAILKDGLHHADDGELFLERARGESFVWDDGRLKSASYDSDGGFGLRVVAGEAAGYAHANEISSASLTRASKAASIAKRGHSGTLALPPVRTNAKLYSDADPLAAPAFEAKIATLAQIDYYLREKDPRVVQVSVSLAASRKEIAIMRPDGDIRTDIRPLVRVNVSVTAEKYGRRETGSAGAGGRTDYSQWIEAGHLKALADEALRIALVNLDAVPAPVGEMDVVLGPGWPGILLHEAVGHGLEGDFNRKGTSAFSGKIGQRVASPGVTVVDDGTLADRRGSLTIDDEGTPTQRTVLIEDGILVGYLQDRMNARLMGVVPTGNGRRESYAHSPMPRMTNTMMESGALDPNEIITSLKRGIYATHFGGGSVDITSGKFVFQCTEAYLVENGKIIAPVKGASLIGDGPTSLTKISMIGNDATLDHGVGTCGKAGQSVPVGVGQPTLRIGGLTVGGAG
ncbi:metalloprotease TldD [Candidatus Phycosocius spiralis]|uniref:Peptidase C69 n=1 Tax=Candidatus Phycosocius spiralis TaxID=2815099 RepID=A0ABQ4PVW8_9PROT|nr:metalloprotease TldD [Candidatus Phycosocius spiralis]GIU67181.1 peptidase C69 [Candidatus Phycosocius spiralis]